MPDNPREFPLFVRLMNCCTGSQGLNLCRDSAINRAPQEAQRNCPTLLLSVILNYIFLSEFVTEAVSNNDVPWITLFVPHESKP